MTRARTIGLAAAAALGACGRVEVGRVSAASVVPEVQVALAVNVAALEIGGGEALVIIEPDGRELRRIAAGVTERVEVGPGGGVLLAARSSRPVASEMPVIRSEGPAGFVRVGGKEYRGSVTILRSASGLVPVNRVDVESYVAGVVNAELGPRPPAEIEALKAQAVASRTVALRAMGRARLRGYDLVSTVADQVYGGVTAETELGREAVAATHGEAVTYDGVVIDAFFSSTCGGRTASGGEVFLGTLDRAYLRSVSDLDLQGTPWCAGSPRIRWREEWSARDLAAMLRETLPLVGRPVPPGEPRDVVISERTPSGRVARLGLVYGQTTVAVSGPQVRQVLRPAGQVLLRSAQFTLVATRSGGRIERLAAEGVGAGHSVGLCQWGTIGRARAGFNYREILAAYFSGTEVRRQF